jgi:hypothetical protein
MNHYTQTPVNAVWFVMVGSAICGLLGFSTAALTSLAGCVLIWYISEYSNYEIELRSLASTFPMLRLYSSGLHLAGTNSYLAHSASVDGICLLV